MKLNYEMFRNELSAKAQQLLNDNATVFVANIDKDVLYNTYLETFKEGDNELFITNTEHDCSTCRSFVNELGNIVALKQDGTNMIRDTIWNFKTDSGYQYVVDVLNNIVMTTGIKDIYLRDKRFGSRVGLEKNVATIDSSTGTSTIEFVHFFAYADKHISKNVDSDKGSFRSSLEVFKRALDTIGTDSIEVVLELINQNSLYRGMEHKRIVSMFLDAVKEYNGISGKADYVWLKTTQTDAVLRHIRNSSIGTLLVDVADGVDLDTAVRKFEAVVAPANYKRPAPVYTAKMVEQAKQTVEELGLTNALGRRHARLSDITVNNILFSNKDAAKQIKGSVFDDMLADMPVAREFNKTTDMSIDDFISNVLPTAKSIEAYVENRHSTNLVSLIAPSQESSDKLFKWTNGFSWAYEGNLADADIRTNVKAAGGRVDGYMRFSIQWNDLGEHDNNDLDAHCEIRLGPVSSSDARGHHIYYGRKEAVGGTLDVDIISPSKGVVAVENIVFVNKPKEGVFDFYVYVYSHRGGTSGFRSEIELDGVYYQYNHKALSHQGRKVQVATVTIDRAGSATIKHHIPHGLGGCRDISGVKTGSLVPVTVMMHSPNYWDGQVGIGNKHYFFMLKGCVREETPNGFYNEFLNSTLDKHRKVFAMLGSKLAVEKSDEQLSGLGFSSTQRNNLKVRVTGNTMRDINIIF